MTHPLTLIVVGIAAAIVGAVLTLTGATHTVANTFTGEPIHHVQWAPTLVGAALALAGLVLILVGAIGASHRVAR